MTSNPAGKVALVTGASSGIGAVTALHLKALGFDTYAAARRLDRMEPLKRKGIHVLELDLTSDASIKKAFDQVATEAGGVDVLVNNAGYGLYGSIEEVPLDQARRQFEVNLFGLGALTQLVIPHMREQRSGKIVNISSIGGVAASPYGGWYHATKFAVEGFSSSLRQELNPFSVDVVIVRPGGVNTEWRTPAGDSLKKYSYDGPYQKAVRPALTKFMSDEFTKMLADPQNVADVIGKVVTTDHPRAIYNGTSLAGKILFIHKMMMSEKVRDAFTRKFIGLPKTIQP
jgi:NAD(P)-dependent dehydrogenase (short-subunit alcohol dehydrogenase family)